MCLEAQATTKLLVIERISGGRRDRYRSYEVIVNGKPCGELSRGDKIAIEVEPGEVEVYIRIDWCKSRLVRLEIGAESEARLVCRPGSLVTGIFGITFGRNNYVRLEPV